MVYLKKELLVLNQSLIEQEELSNSITSYYIKITIFPFPHRQYAVKLNSARQ